MMVLIQKYNGNRRVRCRRRWRGTALLGSPRPAESALAQDVVVQKKWGDASTGVWGRRRCETSWRKIGASAAPTTGRGTKRFGRCNSRFYRRTSRTPVRPSLDGGTKFYSGVMYGGWSNFIFYLVAIVFLVTLFVLDAIFAAVFARRARL